MILYHLLIYLIVHSQTEHLYSDNHCGGCYWGRKKEKVKKKGRECEGGRGGKKEGNTKIETKQKKYKLYYYFKSWVGHFFPLKNVFDAKFLNTKCPVMILMQFLQRWCHMPYYLHSKFNSQMLISLIWSLEKVMNRTITITSLRY